MTWQKNGTTGQTNGSPIVTGSGTSWVDVGVLNPGDIYAAPDGKFYEILSIQSNTGLTLTDNYLGSTASGQAYAIIPIGLLPSALAQQVKATLTTANAALASAVLSTAAQGLSATQQGNARANIAALGAADVGAGRLSLSVAGNTNVTLTAAQAANQFAEFTGTLTGNINVIVPAAARLFLVRNATSGAYTLTVKTASGSGVTVLQGGRMLIECDATNCVDVVSHLRQLGGSIDGTPIGGTTPAAGAFTTLSASGVVSLQGQGVGTSLQTNAATINISAPAGREIAIAYTNDGAHQTLITALNGILATAVDGSVKTTVSSTGLAVTGALSATKEIRTTGQATALTSGAAFIDRVSGEVTRIASVGSTTGAKGSFILSQYSSDGSLGTDSITVDANGILNVGATGNAYHYFQTPGSEGAATLGVDAAITVYRCAAGGANTAATNVIFSKNSVTSRSINAPGTVNASGADYAEYERNNGIKFLKGSLVGFKADGTLTSVYADAVRFAIKSTNPSYVGGDTWGGEDQIGKRPDEPQFAAPVYTGAAAPTPPAAPEHTEDATTEQLDAYALAVLDYDAAKDAYDAALYAYRMDMTQHAVRVEVAQELFDTATYPEYLRAKAAFEERLEAARQLVDRIAYSGKVPCNVTEATPGGYIIAVAADDGAIAGTFVADPDFSQYKKAVGRVNRILEDGRCEVAVMVH